MIILILFYRIGNKLSHLCTLLLENMGQRDSIEKPSELRHKPISKVREANIPALIVLLLSLARKPVHIVGLVCICFVIMGGSYASQALKLI